jgi:hypothetical protein
MIKKTLFEEELYANMAKNLSLKKIASTVEDINDLNKAIDYLNSAAEIFEEFGMDNKADSVLSIILKIAHHKNLEELNEPFEEELVEKPHHKDPKHFDIKTLRTKDPEPKDAKYFEFESLKDNNDIKNKSIKPQKADVHTKGLTSEKMVKNILNHGTPFNMYKDMSDLDINDAIEVNSDNVNTLSDFEDEL